MLKKIREGEKGFTLVELLAVIVILGIIVAIAIPAIGSVINRAEGDADEQEQALIIDAARLYEMQEYEGEYADFTVEVQTLIANGYLDERQGEAQGGSVSRVGASGEPGNEDADYVPGELKYNPPSDG